MCICVYIRASSHLIDRHDRQTDIDTLTDRQTHIRMYRHADRWSDQTDEHTYGHADRWTYKTEGRGNSSPKSSNYQHTIFMLSHLKYNIGIKQQAKEQQNSSDYHQILKTELN